MRKNISFALFALWTSIAQIACAQDAPPPHCDGSVRDECKFLAELYRSPSYGITKIPNDPARADALIKTAIEGAIEGCSGANYDLCYTLIDDALQPSVPLGEYRYTLSGRVQTYLSGTEAGCDSGYAMACYWRSEAFPDFLPETYEIGVSLEMAEGKSRDQAEFALIADRHAYLERSRATAKEQVATLRRTCTAQNTNDCAALGKLLFSFRSLANSPTEHLTLLMETCSNADPGACDYLGYAFVDSLDETVKSEFKQQLLSDCHAGNAAKCIMRVALTRSSDTLDIYAVNALACKYGSGKGCLENAVNNLNSFERSKDPNTQATAVVLLFLACKLKTNKACHLIEHLTKS